MTKPTLIRNAKLIDPAKSKVEDGAILFADKILDVGAVSSAPDGADSTTPSTDPSTAEVTR